VPAKRGDPTKSGGIGAESTAPCLTCRSRRCRNRQEDDSPVDDAIQLIVDALAAFEDASPHDYTPANLLAVLSTFQTFAGKLAAARDAAEQSVELSRRLGNPSQLAIALAALGATLVDDDPSAALAALDESVAITDAGGSDVLLTHALATAAVARASLGDTAGSLELLRRSLGHSVFCGDLPGLAGAIAQGLAAIIDSGRAELMLLWAATIDDNDFFVHDRQRQLVERAESRASESIDPERRAEIRATVASLSFDEAVDRILAELDVEIAAARASSPG
jgi:hypothetical protein